MGITIYTGEKRDRGQSEWRPNELSEVTSVLAFAFTAFQMANVLILTGVDHELFAERAFDYHFFISVEKAIGDWRSAIKYVQDFCLDIRHRISGKRISRRPYPVIVINDVDYWISGGTSGLFAETCDPVLIERVNELGKLIEPFNGHLVVMAAVTKLNERFSEVLKEQNWIWRQRNEMACYLTGIPVPLQQEHAQPKKLAVKSNRTLSVPTWCHGPKELHSIEFYYGPLTGQQKQLALWICGKEDRRQLITKAENGVIWVRKYHKREYEVFFKSERAHELAKEYREKFPPKKSKGKSKAKQDKGKSK